MALLHSSFILIPSLVLLSICRGVTGATFTFVNKCDYTVWPGILASAGSPRLDSTGFELRKGGSRSLQAPTGWSGRFWGRTGCNFDRSDLGSCATGDCGSGQVECNGNGAAPPATLAEFTLGSGGQDFYDVSLVDGYNLPMIVEGSGGSGTCATTGCVTDLNQQCPSELKVGDGEACKSACATLAIAASLHVTGIFPLYTLIDEFGSIMTVAILSGILNSIIVYAQAVVRGRTHRLTGYPIYDFFMGAELNPRIGILDFKMFYEVRIPWFILFLITASVAARQYETYGYVSAEVLFLMGAHFLYANACSKGEQLIITSWDMYFEKLGFILTFWNMAGVPFTYCHCALYLANHEPSEYRWSRPALLMFSIVYLFMYWMWDSANGQKNSFRQQERGQLIKRKAFPHMPWTVIENPRVIETKAGDRIMVDGWFAIIRKPNYVPDMFFSMSWGLITGFKSPFPWFYFAFFMVMIIHRARRDIARCRRKYGDAWAQYEKEVPYLFIPYII